MRSHHADPSPGRSALRGVREVPAGCVVVLSGTNEEVRRYWTLEARPHEDDLDVTLTRVRELVEDAITRDVRGIHPAVLLSGGLDSSSLTGWATKLTAQPPLTFTVAFGDGASAVPDRPYSQDVARMWQTDHREVLVRPQELSDPVVLATVLAAKDYPSPFGDKNITPSCSAGASPSTPRWRSAVKRPTPSSAASAARSRPDTS